MTRVEHIGAATLYLGDAREILPTIKGAALLLSDPPYRVTSGGFGGDSGALAGGFSGWIKDSYDNGGSIVTCNIEWADWLPLIPPALAEDAHAYIFSNDRNLHAARAAAEDAGLLFHRLLVWNKKAALPNRWYQQICEFVLFMRKGKAFQIQDCASKSLVTIFQRDESPHPTEKPVELCRLYIENSTQPGAVVLDPFMGSGTTGVAAVRSGRAFVGIELEEQWFDVACKRIEAAMVQGSLFGEAA